LDLKGLNVPAADVKELLRVDTEAWKKELPNMEKFFAQFGTRFPKRLQNQLNELNKRLG